MLTYDDVYRQPGFYWGKNPNRICQMALDLFPADARQGKKAIDFGCGEGRDVIHLAKHGFSATGVDISLPGLEKAQAWAAEEGLSIRTMQAGLHELRLDETYDLIYSSGTVTYIPPEQRAAVFAHWKEQTAVGGINAFNAFVAKPYIETAPDWGADEYFFRSGDLLSLYWDWEILHFSEFVFDCNSSGVPHKHAMDVMIARKVR